MGCLIVFQGLPCIRQLPLQLAQASQLLSDLLLQGLLRLLQLQQLLLGTVSISLLGCAGRLCLAPPDLQAATYCTGTFACTHFPLLEHACHRLAFMACAALHVLTLAEPCSLYPCV